MREFKGVLSKLHISDDYIFTIHNFGKKTFTLDDIYQINYVPGEYAKNGNLSFRMKDGRELSVMFNLYSNTEFEKVYDELSSLGLGTYKKIEYKTEKQIINERIENNKKQGIACCPKCGSTSLSANKKGFGFVKGVVGAALTTGTLGAGMIAGGIGANKIIVTCLNCGHRFKPGKK